MQDLPKIISLIDLTSLGEHETSDTMDRLLAQAVTPVARVAALCVFPRWVQYLKERIDIPIATVVNFPHGKDDLSKVLADIQACAQADEIDCVFPYHLNLDDDHDQIVHFVTQVVKTATPRPVKMILETGAFMDPDHIRRMSDLCLQHDVRFLKTSTGKISVGATLPAAEQMLQAIKASGKPDAGFKASGGIRTLEDASQYIDLAVRILGKDFVTPRTMRIGASSLLQDLLKRI